MKATEGELNREKKKAKRTELVHSVKSAPALEGDYILLRFSSLLPQISCKCGKRRSSLKENRPLITRSLIPGDRAVILPIIIPTLPRSFVSPAKPLFDMIGLTEVECLNPSFGGPASGQCQFACISMALSDSLPRLGRGTRLDLELRRLALRVIETNPTMYQDFLTAAGSRTRSKRQCGGSGVDMKAYINTMSNPSCDGDAVTLQALCDSLKITVRIVKLIDAGLYDRVGHVDFGLSSSRERGDCCQDFGDTRETSPLILDDDSFSSDSSDASSYASALSRVSSDPREALFPYTSPTNASIPIQDKGVQKRLYITHDIQPRNVTNVDNESKRLAHFSKGRLIWLSHIGDEAHYRLLRLKHICDTQDSSLFNRDEEIAASESRIQRLLKLQVSN